MSRKPLWCLNWSHTFHCDVICDVTKQHSIMMSRKPVRCVKWSHTFHCDGTCDFTKPHSILMSSKLVWGVQRSQTFHCDVTKQHSIMTSRKPVQCVKWSHTFHCDVWRPLHATRRVLALLFSFSGSSWGRSSLRWLATPGPRWLNTLSFPLITLSLHRLAPVVRAGLAARLFCLLCAPTHSHIHTDIHDWLLTLIWF